MHPRRRVAARIPLQVLEGQPSAMRATPSPPQPAAPRSPIGIDDSEPWSMADTLRGSTDAAEYKHVVPGPIFLKYISDAFEERHAAVLAQWGEETAEDPDEYTAEAIFWVPPEARWANLSAQAGQPSVGTIVDDAMAAMERDNPALCADFIFEPAVHDSKNPSIW